MTVANVHAQPLPSPERRDRQALRSTRPRRAHYRTPRRRRLPPTPPWRVRPRCFASTFRRSARHLRTARVFSLRCRCSEYDECLTMRWEQRARAVRPSRGSRVAAVGADGPAGHSGGPAAHRRSRCLHATCARSPTCPRSALSASASARRPTVEPLTAPPRALPKLLVHSVERVRRLERRQHASARNT